MNLPRSRKGGGEENEGETGRRNRAGPWVTDRQGFDSLVQTVLAAVRQFLTPGWASRSSFLSRVSICL